MDLFHTWLVEKYIAHRGLHDNNAAENSLSAFKNAIDKNYAIELDVHQISDGTLVVFHDETLSRMTGKDGYLQSLTKKDLKNHKLGGTEDCIPTLDEVLKLVAGRVPLLIEVKNETKIGSLEQKLYDTLKKYNGEYAIQSFNPYVLIWFKENAPEVIRGQLSSKFKHVKLSWIKKYVLKRFKLNKQSQPHFISYNADDLPSRFIRRYKNLPLLAWTVRSQNDYLKVIKYSDNIIFEGFEPKI